MQFVDLEGGDLGLTDVVTDFTEFHLVVKTAAKMLADALMMFPLGQDRAICHPIKLRNNVALANVLIREEEFYLPKGVTFYSSNNHKVFELRGQSGGITTNCLCYLIART